MTTPESILRSKSSKMAPSNQTRFAAEPPSRTKSHRPPGMRKHSSQSRSKRLPRPSEAPAAWSRSRLRSTKVIESSPGSNDPPNLSPQPTTSFPEDGDGHPPIANANDHDDHHRQNDHHHHHLDDGTDKDKILNHFFGDTAPSGSVKENGTKTKKAYSYSQYHSPPASSTAAASSPANDPKPPKIDKFGFLLERTSDIVDAAGGSDAGSSSSDDDSDDSAAAAEKPMPSKRISKLRKRRTTTLHNKRHPKSKKATAVREKREKKWIKMMKNWERTTKDKHKKLVRRLRKGVPNTMRGAAWSLLGNVPNKIDFTHKGEYMRLVREADDVVRKGTDKQLISVKESIERDIHRTFPRHFLFCEENNEDRDEEEEARVAEEKKGSLEIKDSKILSGVKNMLRRRGSDDDDDIEYSLDDLEANIKKATPKREAKKVSTGTDDEPNLLEAKGGQASLRRVLRAYSIYDQEVGYCQGMNFIAAMFITLMTEEEAFWLLVAVMNNPPCKMRNLYGSTMTQAQQVLHVASSLISQFLPRLSAHLDKENVHITMFATQWLVTLYTSSFPFELVTRVWDCFLAEGWKIVYRVMLAILTISENDLLKLKFEGILGYLKTLPDNLDGNEVMNVTFKLQLKRKHIEKYEKEWEQAEQRRVNEGRG